MGEGHKGRVSRRLSPNDSPSKRSVSGQRKGHGGGGEAGEGSNKGAGVSSFHSFSLSLLCFQSFLYQGGEEGRTWDRKGMLSMGLMAMLSGPAIFMGMGVVMATGWAIFMGAEAGMLTEAMLTGPVMVTG